MRVLRQISQVLTGVSPASDGIAALGNARRDCLVRAERLRADAARTPYPGAREELLALARMETDLAHRISELLAGRVRGSADALRARSECGRNHWARLVARLEDHRAAVHGYRDCATRLTETAPAIARAFERLSTTQATLCVRLRALIARADPQAID